MLSRSVSLTWGKMMSTKSVCAMFSLLVLASQAHAGLTIIAEAEVPTHRVKDYRTDIDREFGEPSLELTQSASSIYSAANAYGYARPGVLKAYAHAATSSELSSSASASAFAMWEFSATLSNAALAGKKGQFTIRNHFDYAPSTSIGTYPGSGTLAASGHFQFDSIFGARTSLGLSYADFLQTYSWDNQGNATWLTSHVVDDANGVRQEPGFGMQELVVDFVWGEPILFHQMVGAACSVYETDEIDSTAGCFVDSTHSSYWGGLSNVTANGVAVPDYAIVTDAGIDLRQSLLPVPEPESWAMMVLGGLLIAGVGGHRRKKDSLIAASC
ncbi:PEP-CTERM sorting domain-containing protein [Massilia violaceinigra]|nr:PEP-CTERM sorting domain-containing protein [Massilia violaceinigra]